MTPENKEKYKRLLKDNLKLKIAISQTNIFDAHETDDDVLFDTMLEIIELELAEIQKHFNDKMNKIVTELKKMPIYEINLQ